MLFPFKHAKKAAEMQLVLLMRCRKGRAKAERKKDNFNVSRGMELDAFLAAVLKGRS
jgi:hypothetical protein